MSSPRTVTLRDGELVPDAPAVEVPAAAPGEVAVRRCPGGPWLVRGADAVVDEAGDPHPTTRPVVAVCACAKTQRAPWCDGTHKVVRHVR